MSSWTGDYDEPRSNPRQALKEAFKVIHPEPARPGNASDFKTWAAAYARWVDTKERFHRFLDAEAWTDAALCFVPEGWLWEVQWIGHQTKDRVANARIWKRFDRSLFAVADHPALALAQACLKARENGDG